MSDKISVVIPTYNEKETIGTIIQVIIDEVPDLEEIIVVDDDSPDKTWEVALNAARAAKLVKVIRRQGKLGLTSAIWEGIINAKGGVVLWLDADFRSDPGVLSRMTKSIGENDIVVASRYVAGAKDLRREKIRVFLSAAFNRFARFLLKTKTRDLTSGYILAKREIFNKLVLSGSYGEYCVDLLYRAEKDGLKIHEMPYSAYSRAHGLSKTSANLMIFVRHMLIYLKKIFRLRFDHG